MTDSLATAIDIALVAAVSAWIGVAGAFLASLNPHAPSRDAMVVPPSTESGCIPEGAFLPDTDEPEPEMPVDRLIDEDFLAALAAVESGGDDSAVNAREDAHGRFQVRAAALADANRILGEDYTLAEMHDPAKAERVVRAYLGHYGSRLAAPTREDLARVWNGGPRGHERAATRDYGARFRALWEDRHA